MSTNVATARSATPRKRANPKLQEGAVLLVRHAAKCVQCRAWILKGGFLQRKGKHSHCLSCVGLGHLVFLPRGDTALTRRASKYSTQQAIVVQRVRGRLARQGMF